MHKTLVPSVKKGIISNVQSKNRKLIYITGFLVKLLRNLSMECLLKKMKKCVHVCLVKDRKKSTATLLHALRFILIFLYQGLCSPFWTRLSRCQCWAWLSISVLIGECISIQEGLWLRWLKVIHLFPFVTISSLHLALTDKTQNFKVRKE